MMDTKQSSLTPVPRLKTPQYPSYLQQLSNVAACFFADMRHYIPKGVEPEPLPAISSLWDRLMTSLPVGPCYISVSITKKHKEQKGALIRSLIEFAPHLNKYRLTQHGRSSDAHGHHPQVCVGFNNKQPLCFISTVEAASSTFRYPGIVKYPPPMIPTIHVTDIDGPQPSGAFYCYLDESHKAMSSGGGLLWREWKGKFSPNRNRYGAEARDQTYFEGVPPAQVEEVGHYAKNCLEFQEETYREPKDQVKIANPVTGEISGSKELEWWEIECDEGDNFEGESDSDLDDEDEDEDESDSDFSESEDGDDEYEDDSEDDDSGENSDLEEESDERLTDNRVYLITSQHLPLLKTPIPPSHPPKPDFPAQTQAGSPNYYQDTQDLEVSLSSSSSSSSSPSSSSSSSSSSFPYLSIMDSDFESYNSSATMSSLSPTPVTPASPLFIPLDTGILQKVRRGHYDHTIIRGTLQIPEILQGLMASLDLDLRVSRKAEWELDNEVSLGQETLVGKSLSIEGLDLAGWNH